MRDHICHIYDDPKEWLEITISLIQTGLKQEEKLLYIIPSQKKNDLRAALTASDPQAAEAEHNGKLRMPDEEDFFPDHKPLSPDNLIAYLLKEAEEASAQGFKALKTIFDMSWILSGETDSNRMLAYEVALDRDFPLTILLSIVCQYDRNKSDKSIIRSAILTHRFILREDKVCENPRYLAPKDLLAKHHDDAEIAWMLDSIEKNHRFKRYHFSEHDKIRAALKESEAFNRLIMDNLPIGLSVNSVEPTVRFQYANENFLKIYGIKRRDLAYEDRFWEAVYEDEAFREKIRERVVTDCTSGDPSRMVWEDVPITRNSDIVSYITAVNIPVPGKDLMISTVIDVTNRKQAEIQLQEKIDRLNALFHNSPSAIMIFDDTGRYIEVSKAAAGIIGFPVDEIPGKHFSDVLPPEIASHFMRTIETIKRENRAVYKLDTLDQDGQKRVFESRIFPIAQTGDKVLFGSIVNDITERKRAEDTLRKNERELAELLSASTSFRVVQNIDDMPYALLDHALSAANVKSGAVWLFDPSDSLLHRRAARGWFSDQKRCSLKPGVGMVGKVFLSGKPSVSPDPTDVPPDMDCALPSRPKDQNGCAIPIHSGNQIVGVLSIAKRAPDRFTPAEVRLIGSITEMAGITIQRINLYQETLRRLQHLQALSEIDKAINTSHDVDVTLEVVLDKVRSQLMADASIIFYLGQDGNSLYYKTGFGFRSHEIEKVILPFGEGAAGQSALIRETIVCVDQYSSLCKSCPKALAAENFHCCVSIPMIIKGVAKGVLAIYQKKPYQPDEEWLRFAETLAGQAVIAVDNAELYENLQNANLELSLSYDATIEGWSRALDLRDHDTEGHSKRVAEMTVLLAAKLGMPESDLVHIRRGALLHDIGKVGISDTILLKTGKLDREEWSAMKRHPQMAYDLLYPIPYLRAALDIPLYHHEKYNGSGYPQRLKDNQIPLPARIFAVVDVFDALTSQRPYRPPWSKEAAISHIRKQSGIHFDPEIVETFLKL